MCVGLDISSSSCGSCLGAIFLRRRFHSIHHPHLPGPPCADRDYRTRQAGRSLFAWHKR
ncbi:hypothetical protein LIA77_07992 [Sarocladium implicatum]|nr:hypothetical protein LIA77_07992 [Sarocladium implicatum]